jgi:membrane-associated protease RseP (regulator of RpoE activity)
MREIEFGPVALAGSVGAVALLATVLPAAPLVLAGLTVLVLVHEGGHLVAARRSGMLVTEFFAGFGPVIVAWRTKSGLRVGVKAIPAGGYVKVVGMTAKEQVDPVDEARTFRAATRSRRLAVVAAGPLVNLALGLVLLAVAHAGDPTPGQDPGALGAVRAGWRDTTDITVGTVDGVARLIGNLDGYDAALSDPAARAGEVGDSRFLSPVGVAQISDDVAAQGPWTVLRLIGIVSIGLGVMNLLPFPPLDGGHAAVVGLEWLVATVLRRPSLHLDSASPAIAALTLVTLVFVLCLGASAIVLDVASPVSL